VPENAVPVLKPVAEPRRGCLVIESIDSSSFSYLWFKGLVSKGFSIKLVKSAAAALISCGLEIQLVKV
jgi:hypothetical protein